MNSGLNRELGKYPESGYVRCKRCGFWCNTSRDTQMPYGSRQGFGIQVSSQDFNDLSTAFDSPTTDFNGDQVDPVVTAGCPKCGCLVYNK